MIADAVIPARSGSKGVPGKNVKRLAGRPLIAYSIAAALKSERVNRVIVSTDSEEYADVARAEGAEVPFLRPANISGDESSDLEFVEHFLEWVRSNEGHEPDFLVHLRPVVPLRDPGVIDSAIAALISNPDATALRSVHEMPETAYKTCEIDGRYLKAVGSGSFELDRLNEPRQQFPKTYRPNGYVDVLSTSFIRTHGKLHGDRVIAHITPMSWEVDTMDDLEFLEWKIKKDWHTYRTLFEDA